MNEEFVVQVAMSVREPFRRKWSKYGFDAKCCIYFSVGCMKILESATTNDMIVQIHGEGP